MLFIIALIIFDFAFIIYIARAVAPARNANYNSAPRARHAHTSILDDIEADAEDDTYVPSSRQSRQDRWERNEITSLSLAEEAEMRDMAEHRRNMFAG